MSHDYDVVVVGLGAAGLGVAAAAGELGLRLAAIERHRVGGRTFNSGLLGRRLLLQSAHARAAVGRFDALGFRRVGAPAVDDPFTPVNRALAATRERLAENLPASVTVRLAEGDGCLEAPHIVRVGERRVSARAVVLGPGAVADRSMFPGLEAITGVCDGEDILGCGAVPRRVIVLGGGGEACEIGQALARLGTAVAMVHVGPNLLPDLDDRLGVLLEERFRSEGIQVVNGRQVEAITQDRGTVRLRTKQGDDITAELVIAADRRRADVDGLGLETVGVAVDDHGWIRVDGWGRTSVPGIYAVGTCTGVDDDPCSRFQAGRRVLAGAMLPFRLPFMVPRPHPVRIALQTDPEVAAAGALERELRRSATEYERVDLAREGVLPASATAPFGFWALVDRRERLLGLAGVGLGAAAAVEIWAELVQQRAPIGALAARCRLQSSFAMAGWEAACRNRTGTRRSGGRWWSALRLLCRG